MDTEEEVEVLGEDTEDEVKIVGVDYGADCVCISRNRKRRTLSLERRSSSYKSDSADLDDCIIIGKSESDGGGGDKADFSGPVTRSDGRTSKEKINHLPEEPSVNTPPNIEPAASGSTPIINAPSLDELSEDPLLDSIFSSISDNSSELTSAQAKDQTVPSMAPYHVPPPSGILTEVSRTPKCWTVCPNCPMGAERKYHLVDVMANSAEWAVVATQLVNTGFTVNRIRRIQNESLWQRLCYEKQLMLREKKPVNEQLLYHTSQGEVEVIAEEGLDSRLSTNGCFGTGIYFSDNPIKCNHYWRMGIHGSRHMFCCRVLLGDIKRYPDGVSERLKREPRKEEWKPGDPNKYYDSVKGNLSGQNEFVVYNMYRVMPEYVLYYDVPVSTHWQDPSRLFTFPVVPRSISRVLPSLGLGSHSPNLQQMLRQKKKKRHKGRRIG